MVAAHVSVGCIGKEQGFLRRADQVGDRDGSAAAAPSPVLGSPAVVSCEQKISLPFFGDESLGDGRWER